MWTRQKLKTCGIACSKTRVWKPNRKFYFEPLEFFSFLFFSCFGILCFLFSRCASFLQFYKKRPQKTVLKFQISIMKNSLDKFLIRLSFFLCYFWTVFWMDPFFFNLYNFNVFQSFVLKPLTNSSKQRNKAKIGLHKNQAMS